MYDRAGLLRDAKIAQRDLQPHVQRRVRVGAGPAAEAAHGVEPLPEALPLDERREGWRAVVAALREAELGAVVLAAD